MSVSGRINPHMHRIAIIIVLLIALTALWTPSVYAVDSIQAVRTVEIRIPALDIDASITEFPLDGTSWSISPWEAGIGHLEGTGWFDAPGNIALGGHSWMPGNTPGIFHKLDTIQRGDEVIVNLNGQELRYTVSNITTVSLYDLEVLYPTRDEQITLITCDPGSFDPQSVLYQRRVIVTARREA